MTYTRLALDCGIKSNHLEETERTYKLHALWARAGLTSTAPELKGSSHVRGANPPPLNAIQSCNNVNSSSISRSTIMQSLLYWLWNAYVFMHCCFQSSIISVVWRMVAGRQGQSLQIGVLHSELLTVTVSDLLVYWLVSFSIIQYN